MPNVDVFELTFDAIYLTLTGDAPISIWLPLVGDVISNIFTFIAGIFI